MGKAYRGEEELGSQECSVNEPSKMLLEKSEEYCAFSLLTSKHDLLDNGLEDEQSFGI